MKTQKGFTVIELMIAVLILGIMISIALPSFTEWKVRMRVDNEISSIHRLVLTARNTSINMEQPVTICPLNNSGSCIADWKGELSVFIDLNNDGNYNAASNETLIRIKPAIFTGDNLTFPRTRIIYAPSGQARGSTGTFSYCPLGHSDKNRGLRISPRGRAYQTSDIDNDGKDEIRSGAEISC